MAENGNPYEIRNKGGDVVYTATPDLYRGIVSDVLLSGSYTRVFDIFKEPRLAVSFRTVSEGERIEMLREMKKLHDENPGMSVHEGRAKGDLLTLASYMSALYMGGAEIPVRDLPPQGRMEALKRVPQPAMEKVTYCYDLFMAIVDAAFGMDELVKN